MRLVLWILGALAAAGFASCLPPSKAWPLPTGLGGVIGDALLRAPAWLFGAPLSGATRFAVAIVIGIAAFVALALAAGFGWRREADDEAEEAPVKPAKKAAKEAHDEDEEEPARAAQLRLARLALSLRLQHQGASRRCCRRCCWDCCCAAARASCRCGAIRPPCTLVDPHVEAYSNPAQDQAEEIEEEDETEERSAEEARQARAEAGREAQGRLRVSLARAARPRRAPTDRATLSTEAIEENARALESVLGDFGVRGEIINAHPGPVVTLYELEPAPGIKSSRVIGLADDIARSMSKVSARVAVVPGRNAIGIELPNPKREKVLLRELLSADHYTDTQARLPLCLGKTIGGDPVIVDLARMPHLLIAGTTGSGKSVAINTMILQPDVPAASRRLPRHHDRSEDARTLRL